MNHRTILTLRDYLYALKAEGFVRIHVSSVIPCNGPTKQWTQFPKIEPEMLQGIIYDYHSGWFTLVPNWTPKV